MLVSEFYNSTLADVVRFIRQRTKFQTEQLNNDWAVMRWQSCMIANMMSKSKIKPTDLFLLDGETDDKEIKDINSEDSQQVFEKMHQIYLNRKNRDGNNDRRGNN